MWAFLGVTPAGPSPAAANPESRACHRAGSLFWKVFNLGKKMKKIIGLLVLFGWAGVSNATVIYTYTGNEFSTPSTPSLYMMAILELDEAFLPNQGYQNIAQLPGFHLKMKLSPSNGYLSDGEDDIPPVIVTDQSITTGSDGNIVEWTLGLYFASGTRSQGGYRTCNSPCQPYSNGNQLLTDITYGLANFFPASYGSEDPGVWTVQTVPEVPIPATAWLIGSALLGLGVARRKKV
jgi:hypothetical protein